jgi:integrase
MTPEILDEGDRWESAQLPSMAKTRDGTAFNPRLNRWVYRDPLDAVSIDFDKTISAYAPELTVPIKLTLLWYAQNKSAHHLMNMHARLAHFLEFRATNVDVPSKVTANDVLNYKASLGQQSRSWYLTSLAGLLKKWSHLGYPGVSGEVVSLLDGMTLPGNQKGKAVMTMDPLIGPLSDLEVEALQDAVNDAYASGTFDDEDFLLARLFIALGARPSQYASLKVCDVLEESTSQGDRAYFLNMPRAKQRGQRSRTSFKSRALIAALGQPLVVYAKRVCAKYAGVLNDPTHAPLFPERQQTGSADGFEYHQTGAALGRQLKLSLTRLGVVSERTGEEINIAPVRFRRTLGTRAAQEGHGELVIAELLDHSDTQNTGVYVASTPEIARRIDRAVAMTMAPLAQAFKGVLIDDESHAKRGKDLTSRIIDLRIDVTATPMGSCGQYAFCGFMAPIACYTCSHFEPWLDGPHEAVLRYLLGRRDYLMKSTDTRIAAINDRTIYAVAEVIQICEQRTDVKKS